MKNKSRPDLVAHVVTLRLLAGSKHSCKTLVPNFAPDLFGVKPRCEDLNQPRASVTEEQVPVTPIAPPPITKQTETTVLQPDFMAIFLAMQQQAADRDRQAQLDREDRDRRELEWDKRAKLEREVLLEQARLERLEREQRELDRDRRDRLEKEERYKRDRLEKEERDRPAKLDSEVVNHTFIIVCKVI
jgi:hypothetical protein